MLWISGTYLPDIRETDIKKHGGGHARYPETLAGGGGGGHLVLGAGMLHAVYVAAGLKKAGADVAPHVGLLLQAPGSHLGGVLDVREALRKPVHDGLVLADQAELLAVLEQGSVHARVLDRLHDGICKISVCVCV